MIAHSWLLSVAAIAQAAAPQGGGASSRDLSVFVVEIGGVFVAIYFLFLRPQQKQRKQQEEALRSIKKGDEVVTAGGIVGEVIFIKTTVKDGAPVLSMDDRITIKSAESRIIVERGRIARVASKTSDSTTSATTAS